MSDPVEDEVQYDFDLTFQRKIVSLFSRDTSFALRTRDLIKPEYFTENACQAIVRVVLEHLKVYGSSPDMKILPAILKGELIAKRIRSTEFPDIIELVREIMKADISSPGYVADRIIEFAKHQAIEKAILESVNHLSSGQFFKIEEAMKKALAVGGDEEVSDYDYFDEIASRTKIREDVIAGKIVKNGITTGYSGIDCYLYHNGWGRKELSCIMGPAKSGKSLSLGDFSKNASLAGFNVLYVSLEVSKEIIAERIDAALSNTFMRDLTKSHTDVDAAIKAAHVGAGLFKMRDYASGTMKPQHLKRLIERYREDGIVFDLVALDYADIMAANYRSDDLRENLRTIYIDLRAIAFEENLAMLTATQTNRAGAIANTGKATDVGDDWNKARTVDLLIGLNATDAEKAANKARLYWALSRNTEDGFTIEIEQNRQKMQFLTKVLGKK